MKKRIIVLLSIIVCLFLLIICNKIYKWNGFDETDKDILDGYSFELIVKYKDDSTLKAYGYMKYPDEYNIGHEALTNFLESIN